jgi:hypothetical protein
VPASHGLRLNEVERFSPANPLGGKPHPEKAIEAPEFAVAPISEQSEPLSERQVLERDVGAGSERREQGAQTSAKITGHERRALVAAALVGTSFLAGSIAARGLPGVLLRGIAQRALGDDARTGRERRRDLTRSHDVLDTRPTRQQVIGDDPAMTTPPHRLGAHDRAPIIARERAQRVQTGAELLCFRVVGVIPERQDAPVRVERGRRAFAMMTPAAERTQMPVADAFDGEGVR